MATKIGEELKSVFLKVSSAFTVDGVIAKAGEIVEVLEDDAKSLLNRGKAVLAEAEDMLGLGDNDDAQDDAAGAGTPADAAAPTGEAAPAPTDDQPAQ